MISFSVVIPVFRGENTLGPLFDGLNTFFQEYGASFEVIFVWDCGSDESKSTIEDLKSKHPDIIKCLLLSRNFGQHNATICGLEYATGDFVVTMDEDLQHNPRDIALLAAKQKEGNFDVVYGSYEELKHSAFRNITSRILKRLLSIGIPDLHRDYSAFRFIRQKIAKQLPSFRNSYTFLDGYMAWVTTKVTSCTVTHSKSGEDNSSYTLSKLVNHSVNIFITFSRLPIRAITVASFVSFLLGLVYSAYLVVRQLLYHDLQSGFPTLTIILTLGISLILVSIGIIGEYLFNISLRTAQRPNYSVSEKL